MSDLSLQRVGPTFGGSGTAAPFRAGITGAQVVVDGHGKYFEAVMRGNVYAASIQGTGIATGAGLGTAAILAINNPVGSGVYAVLMYAGMTASVAFAAAGSVMLAANTNPLAAAVTGTAALTRNCLLGSGNVGRVQAYTTATLPAAPTAIAHLGMALTGAITVAVGAPAIGRWFDGSVVLYPGSALSIQTTTASGAVGAFQDFIWEEVALFV